MRAKAPVRRAVAVAVSLALIVPSVSAAAEKSTVIRSLSAKGAALWYAVRLNLPAGARYSYRQTYELSRQTAGHACAKFTIRYEDGWYSSGSSGGLTGPGEHKVVTIGPGAFSSNFPVSTPAPVPSPPIGEINLVEEGSDRPSAAGPARLWCEGGSTVGANGSLEEPGIYDILIFVAAADRVARSTLRLSVSRGVRVLRESWGVGTHFYREWDFATVAAHASVHEFEALPGGGVVRLRARAIVRGTRALSFRRRAVALFDGGFPIAAGTGIGVSPSVFSVQGPDLPESFTTIGGTHLSPNRIQLPGMAPGRYIFGVEAHAAPFATVVAPQAGVLPALWLVTADADFPACSVRGKRTRAADGHLVCKPY